MPLTSSEFPTCPLHPPGGFGAAPKFENEHQVWMKRAPSRSGQCAVNAQRMEEIPTFMEGNSVASVTEAKSACLLTLRPTSANLSY